MPLPIFLQPLLLIGHYYRQLTQGFTSWLDRGHDELFGPLEQLVVAVVIISLAMNPDLLPQLSPLIDPYPVRVPVQISYHAHASPSGHTAGTVRHPSDPIQPTSNGTSDKTGHAPSSGTHTGYGWLDAVLEQVPEDWRPHPITLALMILSLSIALHLSPTHFYRHLRESWRVLWPPWHRRSTSSPRSVSSASTSNSKPSSETAAELSVRSSSRSSDVVLSSDSRDGSRTAAVPAARSAEEQTARKKALLEYEANKAAKAKAGVVAEEKKAISIAKDKVAEDLETSEKTQSEKASIARSETSVVAAGKAKDTLATTETLAVDPDSASRANAPPFDALMAGDYRPLKSILKKSATKPRQSKNIHHNYFMTMKGHQAHLVPFPHGLHPPAQEPRHTLWWRNIPKDAAHLMAPPPVPKEVKDVLADELDQDGSSGPGLKDGDKSKEAQASASERDKEREKEKAKEKEMAKTRAEAEAKEKARAKMKESANREVGTATAKASIAPPVQPIVPVDPQVQKATWASQAMLCLLLVYIQQQLGLLLLVFFVWQQLNGVTEQQEPSNASAPIASATATAKAPPVTPTALPVINVPKTDDIPPEMREKLAQAKDQKERLSKQDIPISRTSRSRIAEPVAARKVDKDKQKALSEVVNERSIGEKPPVIRTRRKTSENLPSIDKPSKVDKRNQRASDEGKEDESQGIQSRAKAAAVADIALPRALSAEKRAAYRARGTADAELGTTDKSSPRASPDDNPGQSSEATKRAEWEKTSNEEKKQYLASTQEPRQATADGNKSKNAEELMREKWAKMSEEEKKQYLAEREKKHLAVKEPDPKASTAAKRERWEKLSEADKERYLQERTTREWGRAVRKKVGEASGLTQEDKDKLRIT